MKLPKKVNVMGEELIVKSVKNKKWVGEVDVFKRTIFINSLVSMKLQIEALVHEISEYILYRLGLTQDTKKWRCVLIKHCLDNTPDDADTFVIFINVLTDTLVRNKLIR